MALTMKMSNGTDVTAPGLLTSLWESLGHWPHSCHPGPSLIYGHLGLWWVVERVQSSDFLPLWSQESLEHRWQEASAEGMSGVSAFQMCLSSLMPGLRPVYT
jgi:hypothetical protein